MIADGLGTSLDETVAEFMIFAAIGFAVAGFLRFGKKRRAAGSALLAVAALVGALAFVLPQRYLRPQIAKVRPASTAALEITSPQPDAVVRGDSLRVLFELNGGRLIDRATTKLRPDEGHVHVSIDGTLVGTAFGLSENLDIADLKSGRHTLKAEFVAGDHGPFAPRVVTQVFFLIQR
ncbi:MAG: hypothetical protein ABR548_04990 [Actinomycetota bacterium]|nr:hypothetical protein [Actinomycetota bacterium]